MSNDLSKVKADLIEKILKDSTLPESVKTSMRNYFALREELSRESDRGCALLATAHLDFALEELLKSKLIGNSSHLKDLISFNGGLGTFSAKIKLSYSLGLISKMAMTDIDILRKIRNEFAHSKNIIRFENKEIKELCDKLQIIDNRAEKSPKNRFLNSVSGVSGQIETSLTTIEKFKELKDIDLEERRKHYKTYMDNLFGDSAQNL